MNHLLEKLANCNPDAVLLEGFEDALLGICMRYGQEPLAAYDYDKCIKTLMNDGMTHEEAVEYFEFNVIGAYVGEHTPVFVEKIDI